MATALAAILEKLIFPRHFEEQNGDRSCRHIGTAHPSDILKSKMETALARHIEIANLSDVLKSKMATALDTLLEQLIFPIFWRENKMATKGGWSKREGACVTD